MQRIQLTVIEKMWGLVCKWRLPGAKCSQQQSQQDIKTTPLCFSAHEQIHAKICLSVLIAKANTFHDFTVFHEYDLYSIHSQENVTTYNTSRGVKKEEKW